jgi:hypothetical protein
VIGVCRSTGLLSTRARVSFFGRIGRNELEEHIILRSLKAARVFWGSSNLLFTGGGWGYRRKPDRVFYSGLHDGLVSFLS